VLPQSSNKDLPSPKPKPTKKSKKKKKARDKLETDTKQSTGKNAQDENESDNTPQLLDTEEDCACDAATSDNPQSTELSTLNGDSEQQSNFGAQSGDGEQEADGQLLDELDREVEEFRLRLEAAKNIPPGHTRRKVNFTSQTWST